MSLYQLYDPNTGDYINQGDYMYEQYETYDEDSSGSQVGMQHSQHDPNNQTMLEEESPVLPKTKKPKVNFDKLIFN